MGVLLHPFYTMIEKTVYNDTVGELFMNVLQHMKCIEIRLDFAKAMTSQKQKYALSNATQKVRIAIDHICGLLGNSDMTLQVKRELEKSDLVYVMLLTEKFSRMTTEDLEEVDTLIEDFINNKYGEATQVFADGQEHLSFSQSSQGSDAEL